MPQHSNLRINLFMCVRFAECLSARYMPADLREVNKEGRLSFQTTKQHVLFHHVSGLGK